MSTDSAVSADAAAIRRSRQAERLLIPAGLITSAGNAFQITAASILVFRAGQTTLSVGWLFIAVSIPQVALSLAFGRLVDRVDRRTLSVAADLVSALTAFALPVWLWIGGPATLGSYLANFLLACSAALFMPASNALVKERIRDSRLPKFNSYIEMASNVGMLMASSLAGFLVVVFGATPLFVFNSGTFVASAALTYFIGRKPLDAVPASASEPEPKLRSTTDPEDVTAPAGQPIKRLALLYISGNMSLIVVNTILTALILQTFHQSPWLIGVVDALGAVGFIAGAACYGWVAARIEGLRLAVTGTVACYLLVCLEPINYILLMAVIPIGGFCFAQGRIAARVLLMRACPQDRVGRIFGGAQAFGVGMGVVATLGLSILADHTSVRYAFWGLALLIIGIAVGTYLSLLRPLSHKGIIVTQDRTSRTTADRPVVIVGFVGVALATLGEIQSDNSVVFVEEPDVVRKRQVREKLAGSPLVRELIEWEFHLAGTADEFYLAHRDLDPSGIVPLIEYATPFAARLAERYGLPGAGYGAAQILRDKALLRQVSRAAGIANPESAQVQSPEQVRAFMLAGQGPGGPAPIVLKPANRQASVGTRVIRDAADIDQAWADCMVQDEGVFVPDRPMELRMLAERFVKGHEYSVEMLVRDGEDLFVNVTSKQLFPGPHPVELAHVVPADIPAELADLLGAQTRRLLDAVGFQSGIVHCEWIVSDGTPYLVECAGRFAGDGIVELIQRAYPVNLVEALYAVLKGEPLPVALPDSAKRAAAVRFMMIEPGIVDTIHGVEAAEQAEGVFSCEVDIAPGDRFDGLHSSWDRVGDVMVTADTPAEALRLAEAAVELVQIGLRPAYGAAQRASTSP